MATLSLECLLFSKPIWTLVRIIAVIIIAFDRGEHKPNFDLGSFAFAKSIFVQAVTSKFQCSCEETSI